MGTHALGIRGRICAHRAVAGDLSRIGHQPCGIRHQFAGRCAARHPRSAAARLTMRQPQTVTQNDTLLSVEDLRTYFYLRGGILKAVDGVSFSLKPQETLAIVGESGCGKSMTALSLMRLIPDPPGKIVGGSVKLDGVDLLGPAEPAMGSVRGKDISMILQEPMTSLNPLMPIGAQIADRLLLHKHSSRKH